MVVFFILSVVFLAIWGVMFRSDIYRFMFFTWPFFATTSITACLLLITVMGLSVYAFFNFGLGFPEYSKYYVSTFTRFSKACKSSEIVDCRAPSRQGGLDLGIQDRLGAKGL
jgi:hypothetical protein